MTHKDDSAATDDVGLRHAVQATLDHYAQRADRFRAGTWDHDVSQNMDALLSRITAEAPYRILDLGCGPGRDLIEFTRRGHRATGIDGCAEFVDMARRESGCEVWHQDFLDLVLPELTFDGIFANASLFHVPSRYAPQVLSRLFSSLKPGGVLCCSNPRGNNEEGWSNGRYGSYYDYDRWCQLVQRAGFVELDHFYRPAGLPREQQPWLVTVWRKQDI